MAGQPTPISGETSVCALVPIGEREGTNPIPLVRPFILIGSRNRSHLHLVSKTISRNHACLIRREGGYCLRDLGSRTGIVVNSRRVTETQLTDGDCVEIGSFRFRYTYNGQSSDRDLSPAEELSAVLAVEGGEAVPLDGRTVLIGRRGKADVSLTDQAVSKSHALIFASDARHFIRDLGSRTGTLVNGKPAQHQPLVFGDEIKIADAIIRYQPAVAEATPVEQEPTVIQEANVLQEPTLSAEPTAVEEIEIPEEKTVAFTEDPSIGEGPTAQECESDLEPVELNAPEALAAEPEESPVAAAWSSDPTQPVQSTALALPEDVEVDGGPVPWCTPEGRPIYVRMHVTPPVLWLPTVAELFAGTKRQE